MKVLLVTGMGRSGSTILGNLLGSVPGFACIGESVQFWSKSQLPGWLCGCGQTLDRCDVWGRVVEDLGGPEGVLASPAGATLERAIRSHRVPLLLVPGGANRLLDSETRASLSQLYRALQSATGSSVLVDTSKVPSYGRLLSSLPGVDLYALHIVRDPRAVAFSWQRHVLHQTRDATRGIARARPLRSALRWVVDNVETELLCRPSKNVRLLRLRYEDLMARPQTTLERLLDWVGEPGATVPIDGRFAELGINHAVAGNPNRHAGSRVELREDLEWAARMPRHDRALVAAFTAPLLLRYGYRVSS